MPEEYYVGVGGATEGPYTLDELIGGKASGKYRDSTPIWHNNCWVSLSEFLKLKESSKETTQIKPPFLLKPKVQVAPSSKITRAIEPPSSSKNPAVPAVEDTTSSKPTPIIHPTPKPSIITPAAKSTVQPELNLQAPQDDKPPALEATPSPTVSPAAHVPEEPTPSEPTSIDPKSSALPVAEVPTESPVQPESTAPAKSDDKTPLPQPGPPTPQPIEKTVSNEPAAVTKKGSKLFLFITLIGIILVALALFITFGMKSITNHFTSQPPQVTPSQKPVSTSQQPPVQKPVSVQKKNILDDLAKEDAAAKISEVSGLIRETESASCLANPEKAINLLNAALDHLPENDRYAYNFIQREIYNLRVKQGVWLDFMPPKDFSGWKKDWGVWSVSASSVLEGTAGDHKDQIIIHAPNPVGSSFEIEGDIEFTNNSINQQAGILIGIPNSSNDFIALNFIRNTTGKSTVTISQALREDLITKENNLRESNHILLRLIKGRITCSINKEIVFDEQLPSKEFLLDEKAMLGYGGYNKGNEDIVRYRNFRLRKIAPTPESTPVNNLQ